MKQVEKWGVFEVPVRGRADGNPFLDFRVRGTFRGAGEAVKVDGFYDGGGVYRVRFMPSHEGAYRYTIEGSPLAEPVRGEFEAVAPGAGNHGPVRVIENTALAYADGTPYYSFGTTCYAWVHQPVELQEQTLRTLAGAPFNKIRFCFFPKYYDFNKNEPLTHPFERGRGEGLDPALVERAKDVPDYPGALRPEMDYGFNYLRPNVEHFRRFDLRVRQLMDMGIEADLILMHPYDRWGLNEMSAGACDAYLRYVVARYGAFRNVWWSLANEYDLIRTKTAADWERYGALIAASEPWHHMCSVHNCMPYFDFSRPWVTHQSLQRQDFYRHVEYTDELLEKHGKPVVWDEICYEGNIGLGWGNINGRELVRRFWEAFLRGGHAGHGETFLDAGPMSGRRAELTSRGSAAPEDRRRPSDILWWSHGGTLKGESAPRLAFLRKIVEETPGRFIRVGKGMFDEVVGCPDTDRPRPDRPWAHDYCIHYLGLCQPVYRVLYLPEDERYEVEVIDTWNMTVTPAGIHSGETRIDLPGNQYMAIRVKKLKAH